MADNVVEVRVRCPVCWGSGVDSGGEWNVECAICRGSGRCSAPLASAVDAAALWLGHALGQEEQHTMTGSVPAVDEAARQEWMREFHRRHGECHEALAAYRAAVRAAREGGGKDGGA